MFCMELYNVCYVIFIFIYMKSQMYWCVLNFDFFSNLTFFTQFNSTNPNLIWFKLFDFYSVRHFSSIGSVGFLKIEKSLICLFYFSFNRTDCSNTPYGSEKIYFCNFKRFKYKRLLCFDQKDKYVIIIFQHEKICFEVLKE